MDNNRLLNESQLKVVAQVVDRICEEMIDRVTGTVNRDQQPLRWAMHGGPGTGKTHVIKIIRE